MNRSELIRRIEYALIPKSDLLPASVITVNETDKNTWRSLLADAALGAAVRYWLDSYGLTAKELRQWIANPLEIKRLTSQCSESLYEHLISALDAEKGATNGS